MRRPQGRPPPNDPDKADVGSLEEAVAALDGQPRRVVWVMVPAGPPTDSTIDELAGLLSEGDLVIDGGNSNFHDSQRHAGLLAERDIGFVDAGVSGGVWGLTEGYCIMAGGSDLTQSTLAHRHFRYSASG